MMFLKIGAVRTWRNGQMRAGPIEEVAEGEVGLFSITTYIPVKEYKTFFVSAISKFSDVQVVCRVH